MSTLLRLEGEKTSLVVDTAGGGVPRCVHWGARLGAAEGLEAVQVQPVPPAGLDEPVRASLYPEPGLGFFGQPALRGRRARREWATAFRLARVESSPRRLSLHLREPQAKLALELVLELDGETDVLSASAVLTNVGATPYALDWCAAATLAPGALAREALVLEGAWSREFQERRLPLTRGAVLLRENRRGRTSHDLFPGLVVGEAGFGEHHGRVWGLHLGWSGSSRVVAEVLADGARQVQLGELLEAGEVWLEPGESYRSPVVYGAYSGEGLEGLRDCFHRYVRQRVLRQPARVRPVHFNTWEALYFNHDLGALEQLVEQAAAVGVERFVLDDGWFRGRYYDGAGLGDWTPDPEKYPQGLRPLVTAVKAKGMEFGLWVEPEMVNPESELYRAHPDWVLHLDPLPRPTGRHQLVLDLTRPEVAEHLYKVLHGLLSEHEIGYLKWDMNRDLVAAGSAGVAAVRRQTLAVYALLDRLREAHPTVEIESCASGGGRADYAMLRRTDRVWTSDNNDALERQYIQRGFSLFFPPEVMGAHVGPEWCHTTSRRLGLDFRAQTALFGHMGLELDLRELDSGDRDKLKQHLATYKRFRKLLHGGRSHWLPVADKERMAYGVVSPDKREALFGVFQLGAPELGGSPRVWLRGLEPQARYRVRVLEPLEGRVEMELPESDRWLREGHTLEGQVWMEAGLSIPLARPASALLLHCEQVEKG